MAQPIDFYFDFYSPYGFLASLRIDEMAAKHSREVNWRPFMLGPAFQQTGHQPLLQTPLMGDYVANDFFRSARLQGTAIKLPEEFPKAALAPARAFYWLQDQHPDQAKALAKKVYAAIFSEGKDGTKPELVADLAEPLGVDTVAMLEAIKTPAIKARFKQETQAALERGVFGSPFVIVDDEPFWGNDRLDQVDLWLERGGW